MKYIFHIGERCNSYYGLNKYNILSGVNPLNGIYISFENSIKHINTQFNDFINDIVEFTISKKDNFYYINNIPYNKDKIEELIIKNKFYFFNSENYYKDKNYCINIKYTDINNFLIDDIYFWKNNYMILPNTTFQSKIDIDRFNRRKNRFLNTINNNANDTLLIYMDKLMSINTSLNTINHIKNIYNLDFNLLYIIPTYSEITSDIIKYNNITFLYITFPDINFQYKNNPNDDNSHVIYNKQFELIYNKIIEIYNPKIHYVHDI